MQFDPPFNSLPTGYNSKSNLPPYIEVDLPIRNPWPVEDNSEEPRWQSRHATIEDEEEEEERTKDSHFIENFPRPTRLPHSADKTRRLNFSM